MNKLLRYIIVHPSIISATMGNSNNKNDCNFKLINVLTNYAICLSQTCKIYEDYNSLQNMQDKLKFANELVWDLDRLRLAVKFCDDVLLDGPIVDISDIRDQYPNLYLALLTVNTDVSQLGSMRIDVFIRASNHFNHTIALFSDLPSYEVWETEIGKKMVVTQDKPDWNYWLHCIRKDYPNKYQYVSSLITYILRSEFPMTPIKYKYLADAIGEKYVGWLKDNWNVLAPYEKHTRHVIGRLPRDFIKMSYECPINIRKFIRDSFDRVVVVEEEGVATRDVEEGQT